MKFGDPIYPPPDLEASEETYARTIGQVKDRVMEMWEELRGEHGEAPQSKAAD